LVQSAATPAANEQQRLLPRTVAHSEKKKKNCGNSANAPGNYFVPIKSHANHKAGHKRRSTEVKNRSKIIKMLKNRLKTIMHRINADPPPPWDQATYLWLEVEAVENKIQEEEAEIK